MDTKAVLLPMEGSLSFTDEGEWIHDGEIVAHRGIADYFSSHLKYSEMHHSWVVEADGRAVAVSIADTPAVVRTFLPAENGDWNMVLSGGAEEPFQPQSLSVSSEGKWYCSSQNFRARLLRPAVQHLLSYVSERDGQYYLQWKGQELAIRNDPESR